MVIALAVPEAALDVEFLGAGHHDRELDFVGAHAALNVRASDAQSVDCRLDADFGACGVDGDVGAGPEVLVGGLVDDTVDGRRKIGDGRKERRREEGGSMSYAFLNKTLCAICRALFLGAEGVGGGVLLGEGKAFLVDVDLVFISSDSIKISYPHNP